MAKHGVHFDAALALPEFRPGKKGQAQLMVVESMLYRFDLKENLCFAAFAAHSPYILVNRPLKKPAGRELSALAKVERATVFSPVVQVLSTASRQRSPSHMERLAAS